VWWGTWWGGSIAAVLQDLSRLLACCASRCPMVASDAWKLGGRGLLAAAHGGEKEKARQRT